MGRAVIVMPRVVMTIGNDASALVEIGRERVKGGFQVVMYQTRLKFERSQGRHAARRESGYRPGGEVRFLYRVLKIFRHVNHTHMGLRMIGFLRRVNRHIRRPPFRFPYYSANSNEKQWIYEKR